MTVIKHISVGGDLSQAEWEADGTHLIDGSTGYEIVVSSDIIDEDNMVSNSDTKIPTQQSVKAYADTKLASTGDTLTGPIVLSSGGLVTLRFRPVLDQVTVKKYELPVIVYRGVVKGYQMPIYSSGSELFLTEPCVPHRWDGTSNPTLCISGYLDTANTDKRLRLQASYNYHSPEDGDIVSTGITDIEVETTGTWAQYQSFCSDHIIDYDIVSTDPMASHDILNTRIRRIAPAAGGTSEDIAGNIVITGVDMEYRCNKFAPSAT